jgi:hypothetical protein
MERIFREKLNTTDIYVTDQSWLSSGSPGVKEIVSGLKECIFNLEKLLFYLQQLFFGQSNCN